MSFEYILLFMSYLDDLQDGSDRRVHARVSPDTEESAAMEVSTTTNQSPL